MMEIVIAIYHPNGEDLDSEKALQCNLLVFRHQKLMNHFLSKPMQIHVPTKCNVF